MFCITCDGKKIYEIECRKICPVPFIFCFASKVSNLATGKIFNQMDSLVWIVISFSITMYNTNSDDKTMASKWSYKPSLETQIVVMEHIVADWEALVGMAKFVSVHTMCMSRRRSSHIEQIINKPRYRLLLAQKQVSPFIKVLYWQSMTYFMH